MQLVTGPFRPALERAFQEAFARLRAGDPLSPLAVVAPSRRLADRLQRLALDAVPRGFAAVRFFNVFTFARAIYEEAAPPGSRLLLDDLVPTRILEGIVRRHFLNERYLGRAALGPGPLLSALHELKAAGVEPDRALESLAAEDLGWDDAPKLAEILALYKRYSEELARRNIHVRADVARLAAGHAPRSAFLGTLRHVLYYGFYDLDQNQLDLLHEVRRRVDTTVFFPHRPTPEFEHAKALLRETVAPLAKETRSLPASPAAPRVAQIAASGLHDEVWAAAKEVLRFSDAGVPFEEIAVVARTLDPYVDLVSSIFREHRIPFSSSAMRSLARDPAVKAARLLFSIGDFDRAHVMDLLRSPFFKRKGGDPQLWDQASRHLGIGHGADEWRRRLGSLDGKAFTLSRDERAGKKTFVLSEEETRLFWGHVRALLEAPPAPAGWTRFVEWALARYRRFLEPDPRVEAAIGSLAELEGIALEDPLGALLHALANLREPAGGEGGVPVLDAMAARGLSFRAMIVLGMNERVFPRFILEDAFLRDAVRSRIQFRLGCRIPRKVEGYSEERLLFALLMDAADEIVLCHQRSDDRGRLQIPSAFLPPGTPEQIRRRPAERLRSVPLDLLTPREAALRTGQGEAVGRAMGWDVGRLIDATHYLEAVESRGALTPYDGLVDSRDYWNALAGFGISPTAVEKLSECPFRYFASRMLDLEELEEPETEDEITPVEIGTLYHEILEYVHRGGDLEEESREAFRRFESKRSVRYPVLWEVSKERILRVLQAFVRADDVSVYRPEEFEVELKGELPLSVAGRTTVTFRGFADRLDVGEDGAFRVVDYKRRRSDKFRWVMETGILSKGAYLQPPLYVLLAAQRLGQKDLSRSRFSYAFVEDALDEGTWELVLDGEFWQKRGEFDAMLASILETIPRGEFVIRPGKACVYCEFRTLCRRQHLPTKLRAGNGSEDE